MLFLIFATIVGSTMLFSAYNYSSDDATAFQFDSINVSASSRDWNPKAPWKIPNGFQQSVISDEKALNIYANGKNDWPDMNTNNETGPHAGRYLYRTHEYRRDAGAISVIDLETGKAKILAQNTDYKALDGIHWTPWGTLLFAEEKTNGRLFELFFKEDDLTSVKSIEPRLSAGLLAHEGIEIDSDGAIYLVDEFRGLSEANPDRGNQCNGKMPCGGGIYKYIPQSYGDLSKGALYVLSVEGENAVGQAQWQGPIDSQNARFSGTQHGGTSYQRPEDLEIIKDKLYIAITEGPRDTHGKQLYKGRVLVLDLKTLEVANFVKPGMNAPVEIGKPKNDKYQTGFANPDNLAESPDGRLIIAEDNIPSDIWFANLETDEKGASTGVSLFASLTDPKAEATGIYVGNDPNVLLVNTQHAKKKDGDATWAIRRSR